MAKKLGRVPIEGSKVEFGNWTLEAQNGANRRNRIGVILAEPIAGPTGSESGTAADALSKPDTLKS
jgi:hypothetical protein